MAVVPVCNLSTEGNNEKPRQKDQAFGVFNEILSVWGWGASLFMLLKLFLHLPNSASIYLILPSKHPTFPVIHS